MEECLMEIGDAGFEHQVLRSERPTMVDFWAPWCGPCRAIEPLVEELAQKFGIRMTFAKCNVDDNPITPARYSIKAIPTLLFFKQGQLADQITGYTDKSKLEEAILKIL